MAGRWSSRWMRRKLFPLSVEPIEGRLLLASFSVVNTADSGLGSLRFAIEQAEALPGADDIRFAIPTADPGFDPTTGVWAIRPTRALPEITDEVVIDGSTQP